MSVRRTSTPAIVAVVAGFLLWLVAGEISGRREPWDATIFWLTFYPLGIGIAAGLGGLFPDRPWRWALLLFGGQFLGMCVRNAEIGSLGPLGLVAFGLLSLPAVFAAILSGKAASRHRRD